MPAWLAILPSSARDKLQSKARARFRCVLIAAVVAYAALLRFDAIVLVHGPVPGPRWMHALQQWRLDHPALRPRSMTWQQTPVFPHRDGPPTQYRSDPYTYLQYAKSMRSFYAAHRREPLFPFATRVWLALLAQQDEAVSFAAATFSVLAVYLTYRVGRSAFSPPVGLLAAVMMAVEYQLITTGTEGWRDEAFTCGVLATTAATLVYKRTPSRWRAAAIGAAGGLACLVRITSLSFFVPCLLSLIARRRPPKAVLGDMAVAAGVAAILVGPFLFNCWRVYGDPLYSINVHADVYRAAEGEAGPSETAAAYLFSEWRSRPARTLDTLCVGLTRYPFDNKWTGFDVWIGGAGAVLAVASIIGLLAFPLTPAGRTLLLVLVSSIVPYAFTWRLISDWRFTEHVYPFLLIASALTFVGAATVIASRLRVMPKWLTPTMTLRYAAVSAVALASWWCIMQVLPVFTFAEAIRAGEPTAIEAGPRDSLFFSSGWSRPQQEGNVTTRSSVSPRPTIRVYMPSARQLLVSLRVDPATAAGDGSRATVLTNGTIVARCPLNRDPLRMGLCRFEVPSNVVRKGFNTLSIVPEGTGPIRVWYVRFEPAQS